MVNTHYSPSHSDKVDSFDIRKFQDRLKPSLKGKNKFICPVCGSDNFSVNQRTGAYNCFSNKCSCEDIRNKIAPQNHQSSAGLHSFRSQPKQSFKQRSKQAEVSASMVEAKVDELVIMVRERISTDGEALVTLTTWCQAEGQSAFAATKLFDERLKSIRFNVRTGDVNTATSIEDHDFARLSKIQDQRQKSTDFCVTDILPKFLGEAISEDASILNAAEQGFLLYLLPIIASLLPRQTCVSAGSFEEPPIIWVCVVGVSGCGKTRILKTTSTWLNQAENREYDRWRQGTMSFEKATPATGPGAPELEKLNSRQRYLFSVTTPEAIVKNLGQQMNKGVVWVRDELKGLFDGLDQYHKGKGEGQSILISLWDGMEMPVDRVDSDKSFYAHSNNLSIVGGIQPGVFTKSFTDISNAQGLSARFLFLRLPSYPPQRIQTTCKLPKLLPEIYEKLLKFPCKKVYLSPEADDLFTEIVESSGNLLSPDHPAIDAWVRKVPAHVLRVALALHALNWACDLENSPEVLSDITLQKAHRFVLYCYESFSFLQHEISSQFDMSVLLDKVLEAAKEAGQDGISLRDLYAIKVQSIRKHAKILNRESKDLTLEICQKLQEEGYGKIEELGKKTLRFTVV